MRSGQQKPSERRRFRRAPVRFQIDYETTDQFFTDVALNLSLGGIFVQTPALLPIGTRLRLHFSVPEHEGTIDGWGTVAHIHEHDSAEDPRGMGIALDPLDDGARAIIDGLVSKSLP